MRSISEKLILEKMTLILLLSLFQFELIGQIVCEQLLKFTLNSLII
jgi:hypothetical protein